MQDRLSVLFLLQKGGENIFYRNSTQIPDVPGTLWTQPSYLSCFFSHVINKPEPFRKRYSSLFTLHIPAVIIINRTIPNINTNSQIYYKESKEEFEIFLCGLWGLRCGNKITVIPQYREVFDICANRAAVRFEDGRTGVVDDSGTPLMVTDRCRRLRFLKGELLSVTKEDGSDCYTDLKTNRTYQERPVVFSYGGIELLRVGETFHSRTRKAYASMHGLHKDSLCFYGFYLKIPDYRVPKSCRLVDPVWSTIFDVFACVLEGDDEEVYWCCGCLADRSIVVMDGEGNYYHVEKGKGKRYIACNAPKAGEADFASVVEGLRKEAGRRAESVQRERQQNEEEKRRKRLEEIKDVLPFRMGMKWGLKWGDRIVVPPCYRNICVPVGGYCAFEGNACQWGVMALDGKVVVEARYQKVEIEKDGTVHLTIIPGKVKTINL